MWDRRRYIHFYAESFGSGRVNRSLDILCGDQRPQIVDGYAQWTPVALPLRVGVLVYTGRNAVSMQISLRFMLFDARGTWLVDDAAGTQVEDQIAILEWIAGEGIGEGPSPLVYVSTYDAAGDTNPLIPFQYQTGTPNVPAFFLDRNYSQQWVVTGLSWDPSPISTANGYRIRQDATVTLGMYRPLAGSSPKARLVPRPKATTVVSRTGADSALTIARSVAAEDPPKLAQAIIKSPQNAKLRLRSVNQTIKHGKRVTVPSSTQVTPSEIPVG